MIHAFASPSSIFSASFSSRLGRRTALIEREALGGDCLWTGCVPTKALIASAKLIHQTHPEYPGSAKSRGVQGDVVLRAVISLDGSVGSMSPAGSPDPELAQAAINAVRQWRYEPALLNGQPIETVTTITVNFQLEP